MVKILTLFIQPFDPCFDPTRHNKYLVDKQKWEDQVTRNREEREELFRIWRELQARVY